MNPAAKVFSDNLPAIALSAWISGGDTRGTGRSGPRPISVLIKVRGTLPNLRPAEQRVAEAVLADPKGISESSNTAVARRCQTSETTVLRFVERSASPDIPTYASHWHVPTVLSPTLLLHWTWACCGGAIDAIASRHV